MGPGRIYRASCHDPAPRLSHPGIGVRCSAGVPATKQCVDLGFQVVGVDVSPSLIETARREIPVAEFHISDMLSFSSSPPLSFDCVMIFYALWHLPPTEQEQVLRKCLEVHLKSGGWLLFNLMTVNGEYNLDSFMGAPMTSCGLGVEGNEKMMRKLVDKWIDGDGEQLGGTPVGSESSGRWWGITSRRCNGSCCWYLWPHPRVSTVARESSTTEEEALASKRSVNAWINGTLRG